MTNFALNEVHLYRADEALHSVCLSVCPVFNALLEIGMTYKL